MRIPVSTYRLQLFSGFNFEKLNEILIYLEEMGITDIYASPFFKARKGSTHGYDITDPLQINPEIGTLKEFREISALLKGREMGWVQDIVPNHMAYDPENPWIRDIFELGPSSDYYNFFDINWEYKGLRKLLAPVLGYLQEDAIKKDHYSLNFENNSLRLNYFEHHFPLSARSYPEVLSLAGLQEWADEFTNVVNKPRRWEDLKKDMGHELASDHKLKESLENGLKKLAGNHNKLREILSLQYFLPVYWKTTEKEINYRRFFTINHLICLRMEEKRVFESYHEFITKLFEEEVVSGLRIDHIDGLLDPGEYLENLRKLLDEDLYVVVEKILEKNERLPSKWKTQGTTGYDFLALLNQVFTCKKKEEEFSENYHRLVPELSDYEQLLFERKRFILETRMKGELMNLCDQLTDVGCMKAKSYQTEDLQYALMSFLAAFGVYRIYPQKFPLTEEQKAIIEVAFKKARENSPQQKILKKLRDIFLGEAEGDKKMMLSFLKRCQQFTGPLAAKGGEDTSFYIYNRLISHNEVGDSPGNFGISADDFHKEMSYRLDSFPLGMSTTATHDTKRGEDARMRINVLSEIPDQWFKNVKEWIQLNDSLKKEPEIPSFNEEYFIYQALVGAKAFEEEKDFLQRTGNYLKKALREAKLNSSWAEPDKYYEKEVLAFLEAIWKNENFRESFDAFWQEVAYYGTIKSLAQLVVKCCAPGVPDIYQGTELWDLSYVDPDNRKRVDYELRRSNLIKIGRTNPGTLIDELKKDYKNGIIKQFMMRSLLNFRKNNPDLFLEGSYLPLKVSGEKAGDFLAFCRNFEDQWLICVVPVMVTDLFTAEEFRIKKDTLKDTAMKFPDSGTNIWTDIFSGREYENAKEYILADLFNDFPVAVLKN